MRRPAPRPASAPGPGPPRDPARIDLRSWSATRAPAAEPVRRIVGAASAAVSTPDDADPFESQEPWVHLTASRDQPLAPLRRADLKLLGRAQSLIHSDAAPSELAALRADGHRVEQALRAAERLARERAPAWRRQLWSAQLAHASGRGVERARRLAAACAQTPDAPSRSHQFARLARLSGRPDAAIGLALGRLEREPHAAHARLELGLALLETGRADEARTELERAARHSDGDQRVLRAVDRAAGDLLRTPARLDPVEMPGRCAVLIPGQLRRMDATSEFLIALAEQVDLFVCTDAGHREQAELLASRANATVRIVEDSPADAAREANAPVGSMRQWSKLAICLDSMLQREQREGLRYSHVYKLRTDYYLTDPGRFLGIGSEDDRGLLTASDKVFGGRREFVLPLASLFDAMGSLFLDHERDWWPVRVAQVLASDDSFKWFGMNLPRRVLGDCRTVGHLRRRVAERAEQLERYRPRRFDSFLRLFRGHPRMASEVCFARFLNMLGIPVHASPRLAGFLLSSRTGGAMQ